MGRGSGENRHPPRTGLKTKVSAFASVVSMISSLGQEITNGPVYGDYYGIFSENAMHFLMCMILTCYYQTWDRVY